MQSTVYAKRNDYKINIMASSTNTLCLDDLFDHIEYEEELNSTRNRNDRILQHENFYHGVDLSEFDPCKSLNEREMSKNKMDSLSCSLNNTRLSEAQRDISNLPRIGSTPFCVVPSQEINYNKSLSKIDKFLEAAEIYFVENSINILIKYELNEDQRIIKIFYDLFIHCDVYTIEILYICAKNMEVVLPDPVYEFLKICRFSYEASLKLYNDIGDFTKFHPYFYEDVIKSTLNLLFDNFGVFIPDKFSIMIKLFMAARYHNIKLSGDILRQMLEKISLSPRIDSISIVLDYSLKIGITSRILRQSFTYFLNNQTIFKEIINILKDNFKNSTSDVLRDPLVWNELLIVIVKTNNYIITEDIFEFIISNKMPISLEALDAIFSIPMTTDQRHTLLEKSLDLIDLSVYVPFGDKSFAQSLWSCFELFIETDQPVSTLPLLPYLVRVSKILADRSVLAKFYDQMRKYEMDDSMFCRIRGFIQHFELF